LSDTSLLFNFLRGRNTVSPETKKISRDVGAMALAVKAASFASVAGTVALGAGFVSLAAHAVALVDAVAPVVGIVALLPAGLVAAGAGFAAMKLATGGLGDALKQTAGGGASAGAAIAAAEKRIAQAQREATQAQQALNDARVSAAEHLDDLHRSLARTRLDEESATMAVADAERAVRLASRSRDPNDRKKADLAYRESLQTLAEVRDRLEDVTLEESQASAAGVEGSDQVKSALQRQADAVAALAEAQAALAKASSGGGINKAAEAYAKLSTAGKQLVDVLREIGPQWRTVQQAVQQSVFAGVASDLKKMSSVYLPVMKAQLPAIGQGWNDAFRGTAQLAASAGFVADMNVTLGNTADLWQRVGSSFAPFLNGFRQFAAVGSAFLPGVGSWIQRCADAFDHWATAARETGRAHDWIANALVVLSQVWEIAKNLGSAIASIFRAGDAGPGWLPGLVSGTKALSDFLASPAGQGKVAAVFRTLRDIGTALWLVITRLGPALLNLAPAAGGTLVDSFKVAGVVVGFLADHLDLLAKALPFLAAGFLIVKSAQVLGTITAAADVPVRIWQSVVMWRHTAALRANTAAMAGNEGATKRGIVAMAASKVAMVAQALWSGIATAAQWLWNLSLYGFPLVWIIVALAAIVGGIYLLWTNSAGFRDFFIDLWNNQIWPLLKGIGTWFADDFVGSFVDGWHWLVNAGVVAVLWIRDHIQMLVGFVTGLGEKIRTAAGGMWDGIVAAFKAAVNWLLRIWNNFSLTLGGGTVLGVSIPSVVLNTPDIPYLASGGTITAGGAAVVGDAGPEIVDLPRGASVTPLSQAGGGGRLVIDVTGADEDLKRLIRKWVRLDGGTGADSVQLTFGKA